MSLCVLTKEILDEEKKDEEAETSIHHLPASEEL